MSEHEALIRLERDLAGRYAIEREIGSGAMARVFLARDLKHDRKVALKVLRPELMEVVGAERFLREIRVTATLEHPHIMPLYDSGDAGGLLFYIMPYVAGESLRARLERDYQLPIDEAVAITRTLAGALDYAHRQGVVHRDIKPENILVQDGQPLLADFGIALAVSRAADERLTEMGLSVGTPQYMSPEQATGERSVGPQSDIYSLASVAYEMFVGEPPVTGPTVQSILARVVLEVPGAIRTVRPTVPATVEAAVMKALAKLPVDRFRTAAEFASALGEPALSAPGSSGARRPIRRSVRTAIGVLAALAFVAAVLVILRATMNASRSQPPLRRQLTFSGKVLQAAISPDGRFIAYSVDAESTEHVLVQDVSGGAADTVDTWPGHLTLEWSPDGTRLLLSSLPSRVVVVPRLGGPARRVSGLPRGGLFAYWLPDGEHVSMHASLDRRVLMFDLETSDTVAIPVRSGHWAMTDGAWSPDSRLFSVVLLYQDPLRFAIATVGPDNQVYLVVEDSVQLGSPRWSPAGDALYFMRDVFGSPAIQRVRVSPQTGRPRGTPAGIHAHLEALPIYDGFARFSLTLDRQRAVYTRGLRFANLWMLEIDRPGLSPRMRALTSGTAMLWSPAVSPDGRWIAFAQSVHGASELFTMPVEGGAATQITSGARVWRTSQIAWSADGERIAFQSIRRGLPQVWVATVLGGRLQQFSRTRVHPYSGHITWAPAPYIAYVNKGRDNINLLDPVSGDERPLLPDSAAGFVFDPKYSPDGNRLAFTWRRGAASRGLWIFDLRDSSSVRISESVAAPTAWSADGRYVYAGYPTIYQIDSQRRSDEEAIVASPFREGGCTAAAQHRPSAFVCAVSDFVSDAWLIENFDNYTP